MSSDHRQFFRDRLASARGGAEVADAVVDYLRAKARGDDSAAAMLLGLLGPEVLLAGVTAALLSSVRASGYSVDRFLDELAMPVGASAFVKSR